MHKLLSRAALCLVTVLVMSGCSTSQYLHYVDAVLSGHEAEAKAAVAEYEAQRAEATAGRPCAEWYDLAMSAGFTPEQWKEPLSRIMYRESHCQPTADNPISTATGLTQILRMWVDDCGGTSLADLEDPEFNLECAHHIYLVSGWSAWATY